MMDVEHRTKQVNKQLDAAEYQMRAAHSKERIYSEKLEQRRSYIVSRMVIRAFPELGEI